MATEFTQGRNIGCINFQNFLRRFLDLGFNNSDSIGELIDNSIDAKATSISVILASHTVHNEESLYYLDIIDNGTGMDIDAFEKYFEMFGDKDEQTLQSLGKKGIGGKVALVTLSRLSDTVIISKKKNNDLLFVNVPWKSITKERSIVVQQATRKIEKIWDESLLSTEDSGTLARMYLSKATYDELVELVHSKRIDDRNIYYKVCRNYCRLLRDELQIAFYNKVNDALIESKVCKPLDPLYLDDITENLFKDEDTLLLYKNPEDNNKWVCLKKENNGAYYGFVENKRFSHALKQWLLADVEKLTLVGCITLEHAYICFSDEVEKQTKEKAVKHSLKEEHLLKLKFPSAEFIKEELIFLTGGTHLERNKKETGLLLDQTKKLTGDYDRREFYDNSRHRLAFTSLSHANDPMDDVFRTQVNKSKVDINDIPKIVQKTIETLNKKFGDRIYDATYPSAKTIQPPSVKACTSKPDTTRKQSSAATSSVNIIPKTVQANTPAKLLDENEKVETTKKLGTPAAPPNSGDVSKNKDNVNSVSKAGCSTALVVSTHVDSHPLENKLDDTNVKEPSSTIETCVSSCRNNADNNFSLVSEKVILNQLIDISKLLSKSSNVKLLEVQCSESPSKHLETISQHLAKILSKYESIIE